MPLSAEPKEVPPAPAAAEPEPAPASEPTATPLQFEATPTAAEVQPPTQPQPIAPASTPIRPVPQPIEIAPTSTPTQTNLKALFQGNENSLVARSVGSAEGTRTPDGGRTWAYRGHTDPGNGVWNLGSFSYQHGANSPEEADRKQLQRLNAQAQTLRQHAASRGVTLTLEEELNGIDLANQSPRAALSRGGYIDRLRQAHDMGLQGADAVLWARTRAFLDPDTARWNAPGLGNNVHSITADQDRRRRAIARAIDAQPQADRLQVAAAPATPASIDASVAAARREESPSDAADLIISLDLPPS